MANDEKTRGEQRAGAARENDDSDMIESGEPMPGQGGRSGGGMQRDIATQAEQQRATDPEAKEGRTKEDEMAQGDFSPGPRSATEVVSERKD